MTTFQGQLKALQDNQKLLGLLLFSLITVVIWISISLLTSQKKTAITADQQALAKPLNPSINTEVLDAIEQKRTFQVTDLQSFPIYIIFKEKGNTSIFDTNDQTITVQPESLDQGLEIPSASESATITPEPSPTPESTSEPTPETTDQDQLTPTIPPAPSP